MERYKYYVNRKNIGEINPALFEKHRFFDFRKSDTNILPNTSEWKDNLISKNFEKIPILQKHRFFNFNRNNTNILPNSDVWEDFYKQVFSKYAQVTIIGDKLPEYYNFYNEMTEAFHVPKWIFMLRDIEDVAMSYNKRANNTEDMWPSDANYRRAVEHWNKSLEKTWCYINKKFGNFFCCEYEKLFSYNPKYLKILLDFLEVDFNSEIDNAYRFLTKDWKNRMKIKVFLTESESDYVKNHANFFLANNLTNN